ncbi:unnamed protein product [Ectocarpus sp. 12 AP-2014]
MGNSQGAAQPGKCGYRVLGVQPNSPASKVGLVSFFDFIVAADGVRLEVLDNTFIEMIKASVDKPLPLTVYNYKSMTTRDVTITPSSSWGGQGMLGVTIRFDTYHNADDNLVRVLEVVPGSPSHIAGLQPEHDYLLGTAERVFKDPDILFEEVTAHLDQPMSFYVYNTKTDEVRVAVVLPTNVWGGEGCLGAEVGHGYLHRLPQSCRSSTATSVIKGMSILAADATGGGGKRVSFATASRKKQDPNGGLGPDGPTTAVSGSDGGPAEQGGAGVGVPPGGALGGAGNVIDVDLSG